jgi:hypothetical protein
MRTIPLFVLFAALPLAAQSPAPHPESADTGKVDVLVLDHTFQSGVLERVPVFLQKDAVYRAQLDQPGVQIEVYTNPGDKPPYIISTNANLDPEHEITYEIYPFQDGSIELRVVGGPTGGATRLQLFRDVNGTRRRVALRKSHGPALGIEFETGAHSRYTGYSTVGDAGASIGACLSWHEGPGFVDRTSGCAFGVQYEDGVSSSRLLYFFIEPRVRLFGPMPQGGSGSTQAGVLLRWAFGSFSQRMGATGAPPDPNLLGLGVYVARYFPHDDNGDGWAAQVGLTSDFIYAIEHTPAGDPHPMKAVTLMLGVDRYF